MRRAHKYGAKPQVVDGIRFDSKREAARHLELRLLEKAGEIRDLELQPRFELSVDNADYPDNGEGRSIVLGHYVGDFRYLEKREDGWQLVVEDCKGFDTPLSRWKRKHVAAQYGIQVRLT